MLQSRTSSQSQPKAKRAISAAEIARFQKTIWNFYAKHKRAFPWRDTKNPYHILVSEVMLQQTQADRVVVKYLLFLKKFPTLASLARASEQEVLALWSGLGYNRRALYLKRTVQIINDTHKGTFPKDPEILETFPGLGHYSARAIITFSYNLPFAFIETNIRSVFIDAFFAGRKTPVTDNEIYTLVEATLPPQKARDWYYALMDYGSYLKKIGKGMNIRHASYKKQTAFKGSLREVRGAIIKYLLTQKTSVKLKLLLQKLPFTKERITVALKALVKEGLLKKIVDTYSL